jgi:hypothetical protein
VKPVSLEWECIPDPVYHIRSPSTGVEGKQVLGPSPTGPYFAGDHKQYDISPAQSLWNLTSLHTVEASGVTHLTFEDKSVLCILLINLGQLSTWEPPGFEL